MNASTIFLILLNLAFSFPLFAQTSPSTSSDQPTTSTKPTIFIAENFENTNWQSRGWYDGPSFVITKDQHAPIHNSKKSMKCHFAKDAVNSTSAAARILIPETEQVCLSFWVKFSKSWVGSGKAWHPHVFHFMTNLESKYAGPACSHLTLYIEHVNRIPRLAIQDAMNINPKYIREDITKLTEDRAVAGGNGDSDGYGKGDYYKAGNNHRNGKHWQADKQYFSNKPGPYYKNDWHFIEAYFKLNSIKNGKAIADGLIQYWYDGKLLIDHNNVMLRTAKNPDMKFNTFLAAPHIGHGSPVDQTFWIDNLKITDIPFSQKTKQPETKK